MDKLNPKPAGTYSSDELDLLAICYTAAKVLFVAGALDALPKVTSLIEPGTISGPRPLRRP